MTDILRYSDRIDTFPVAHGSADFAVSLRERLLIGGYDCLAVPLPATWQDAVVEAVEMLPAITCVWQAEPEDGACSYVPIDPCQPIIAALRFAISDRLPIAFIDLETERFEPNIQPLPDPYAIKRATPEQFAAALAPVFPPPPPESQLDQRVRRMAFELHRLELEYQNILFAPNLLDWIWIRQAYKDRAEYPENPSHFAPLRLAEVDNRTLPFFLGELPFITALHERARATLDSDEHLSIDGVKELLLVARERWTKRSESTSNWLTPKLLQTYLQYVRNLTLLNHRLSPDLYTLVVAAKQIGGDRFALALLETARDYAIEFPPPGLPRMRMGIGKGDLPEIGVATMKSRLPHYTGEWRSCEIRPEPDRRRSKLWRHFWDPFRQCSWPIEDERIESFHLHVRQQAKALIGQDLARTEKFTTSVMDGLDLRETLRHWHTGELFVKVLPPSRGGVEIVVFLFDVPADPEKYTWRTTWHAEHAEESTIGLFATDFRDDMVGPGIGRSLYGGVFFLFPPRFIPDIWTDPRLPRTGPLEDRLIAGAVLHSGEPHIAVVSPAPLKSSWKRLAKARGKRLVHLPLSRFSGRTLERLRLVHVLNGKEVRSYAAQFIRDN